MSLFDLRYISELVRAGFTREEIMEMARLPKTEPEASEKKAEKPAPDPAGAAAPEVSHGEDPAPAIHKEETTPHTRTEGTAPVSNDQWLETLAKNS